MSNVLNQHSVEKGSRTLRTLLLVVGIALFMPTFALAADVYEWVLVDKELEARTTTALLRYFSIVKEDSLQARYTRRNAGTLPYRLRGLVTENDSLGQLLLVSLGQLRLFSSKSIRIACGDDLYNELLKSRSTVGSQSRRLYLGDSFGQEDWLGDHTVTLSLDRVDVKLSSELNAFLGIGAPESNLHWWGDGTARLGLASPDWQFALLFPFSGGGTSIGPFRRRLLSPGFGVAAGGKVHNLRARLRFTGSQDIALTSSRVIPQSIVHTVSSGLTWEQNIPSSIGRFAIEGGVGYEEYAELRNNDSGEVVQNGRLRRLSPIVDLQLTTVDENLQVNLGVTDMALRAQATTRLNKHLWFEMRMVSNEIFRERKLFEHSFTVFFTPRIKF